MQDARLHELKMPSIAADAAEARCLFEEHFKVHIKLLRQDKGGCYRRNRRCSHRYCRCKASAQSHSHC